jgi:hypothetical protein
VQTQKQNQSSVVTNAISEPGKPKRDWKKTLGTLSGPLFRLHRYRDVRTMVLHEALSINDRQRCIANASDCEFTRR